LNYFVEVAGFVVEYSLKKAIEMVVVLADNNLK
jgi:hypothetical protein